MVDNNPLHNMKLVVMNHTEEMIVAVNQKLQKLYDQDEPYNDDELESVQSLHEELLSLIAFKKAFSAEVKYDNMVLQKVVNRIVDVQR
jgi:Tfp pilus assembly ATPase PilU